MSERPAVLRQIYLVGAIVAFVSSFEPLWAVPVGLDTRSALSTESLWTVVPSDPTGASVAGLVFVAAILAIGIVAAALPRVGAWLPLAVVVLGVLGVLLLVAKPGTGSPPPSFGPGAGGLFGVCVLLTAAAVVDLGLFLRGPKAPAQAARRTAQ